MHYLLEKYRKPLAMMLLVALSLWGVSHWRFSAGQADANQEWSRRWAERDSADARATAEREAAERAEEQRRQRVADEEQKRADEELAKVQADAADAQRARDGLQQQLATLQRQLAGSETGRLSALAAAGQAKAETGVLLAQLLGEADELAGKFAKEADERYVAGVTCERIYGQVRESGDRRLNKEKP
ncbi:DUF2514 family protein [Salmonella enterica]|uniref:DUF2514 family protein n=1 Tax=Salmonella enterica TaxID=28901 RepID=UPI0009ABF1B1|nr:DUF2514 family protein [Salmonella enterica]